MEDKKIIIDCACGENRYLRFWKFADEDEWSVSLSYSNASFFQKLRYAYKAIFRNDDWDEIIISQNDMKRLKEIV
jgi:hypothetical protein